MNAERSTRLWRPLRVTSRRLSRICVSLLSTAPRARWRHLAQDGGEWREAALRLKGLAASVNALPLMTLAGQAAEKDAADPALLERIGEVVARL